MGCEEDISESFDHRLTKDGVINSYTLFIEELGCLASHLEELLNVVVETDSKRLEAWTALVKRIFVR